MNLTTHSLPPRPLLATLPQPSLAGLLAMIISLSLPIPVLADTSHQTFVVISGRQVVRDGEQACFRLVGDRSGEDRLTVRIRFKGTIPRGTVSLDGRSGPAFSGATQAFEFSAGMRGVHRLALDLRASATVDWLGITAADSYIEPAACSSYGSEENRVVRLEQLPEDSVDRLEGASTTSTNGDTRYRETDRIFGDSTSAPAMTVPAGAELELSLDHALSTQKDRVGQQVSAHLSSPVVVDGRTALPAGTRVLGSVTESQKAGHFGRARLGIGFDRAVLADGTSVPISASVQRLGKGSAGKQAAIIAGSAVGGALAGNALGASPIVGAVVGGGIATGAIAAKSNKPVALPAGTLLIVELNESVAIPSQGNR